ncbi:multiheme c-type cytochrome [Microbulbifer sp. HZ11]|uniref:multiheme c-type cytochrome n=1 Tax=Microbulbifer sp. HZ11 TaxID=1453501 RepID=UPI0009DEF211|nr:multiheme c-type cytochrome [Microbulbifer sp. HZ11]
MRRLSHLLFAVLLLSTVSACSKNDETKGVESGVEPGVAVASLQQPGRGSGTGADVTTQKARGLAAKSPGPDGHPDYVGVEVCSGCHQAEYQDWQKSHHDLAMKTPNGETVVGNFDNATFDYFGTESRFFKRDGQYYVRTDNAEGELQDFPVAYTFGVYPLQQYLIEFPGGRLQALSLSWDSRPKQQGGQRWFHLYPDEEIKAGDPLHWTGINQNWNFQCADCHSTNLHKNYDAKSQSFSTQWSEINVGCEACHGPGAKHVQWAGLPEEEKSGWKNSGFAASYGGRLRAHWKMDAETGIAHIENKAVNTQQEISTCAQCHSRRGTQYPGVRPHDNFLDYFHPALLDENLYHADGQINDEVYVWGSFLQSKMHGAGVTCSNCHNPHSLETRIQGNGLCSQCHLPSKFDTVDHHLHSEGSAGAQCVNCHMPTKTYMQVDARRDHSFRVPRPDLSDKIGSPNACIGCHTEKSNQWAAEALRKKFGEPEPHFGEILFAARQGYPGVDQPLQALALDESQPDIVRATAVSLLPRYLSRASAQMLQVIAQGDDALLHLGLAQSLDNIPQQVRPALAIPLLYEDDRVIRALAANTMVGAPMDAYPAEVAERFQKGLQEYEDTARFNGDRPEALVNLAGVRLREGKTAEAESLLKQARLLAPHYVPAVINLADLYRSSNREHDSEVVLREALVNAYEKAPLQHALGLSLVRQQKLPEAMPLLQAAADSDGAPPRYAYVYGIALNSNGDSAGAITYLEQALQRYPGDREILSALVSLHREAGNTEISEQYQSLIQ